MGRGRDRPATAAATGITRLDSPRMLGVISSAGGILGNLPAAVFTIDARDRQRNGRQMRRC
ncbi:MAG: hypothetical protein DI564_14630 [Rhodanobacter denitrificans]|uniref:Uncharacterized protein n=1 Tax=Rhodanobacter denitrificans TaxID=666685 RepID=A0A2W5LW13_9GAMM|nr:MAG: hypothetical protein DI564_14630 [Rhodanobacter denitrificans]